MGRLNSFGQDAGKSKQDKSGETEAALAAFSCDKMLPTPRARSTARDSIRLAL